MMNNPSDYDSLIAHLKDLQNKCELWHKNLASSFLNEDEIAYVKKYFPENAYTKYAGGYDGARKKKVIFLYDEEGGFCDIVCLKARIDQRFRKISHRDVLGALMHLQVDIHSFGDFWVEDDCIYLYTSEMMSEFLIDNLVKINQLSVKFERIDYYPTQVFKTKEFSNIVASERLDSLVAGITHSSRAKAKELIKNGLVQVNHIIVEQPDKLCDNNITISIRHVGRFEYLGSEHQTKSGRIVAKFLQYI